MVHIGVGHDQAGKRVAFKLSAKVQSRGAIEVVEAIAILQCFKLVFEHKVEGRTQHAAEWHFLFCQSADPKIDRVHTCCGHPRNVGVDALAVEELKTVGRRNNVVCGSKNAVNSGAVTKHQQSCGFALASECCCSGDRRMRAIGRNEVDQRFWMLDVLNEVGPACIRFKVAVAGLVVDVATQRIQRRNSGVASAGEIQRR